MVSRSAFPGKNARVAVLLGIWVATSATAFVLTTPGTPTTPPVAMSLNLRVRPHTAVTQGGELRQCREIPRGVYELDLGAVPESGAVRFGLAVRDMVDASSMVHVYCDETEVATVAAQEPKLWVDRRIDLDDYAGAECHLLVDAKAPLWLSACELTPLRSRLSNVLVVLIDTLRPDHLGCYGYGRDTSPNIDALADDGVRFTKMVSQASWTRSSVASLFTSNYPTVHGAEGLLDPVRSDLVMLPEVFHTNGYETEGFMTNGWCLPSWGFGRGFARYVDVNSEQVSGAKDREAADAVIAALERLKGRPWFVYLHDIGPHAPYDPPAPFDRLFSPSSADYDGPDIARAEQIALYDGAIAFTDAQFGRIVSTLKRLNMYDDTTIVVVADHGEAFGEHAVYGHASSLYDEQIRVPFVVKFARDSAQRGVRDQTVEMVDIAPTLLDFAGLTVPPGFRGVSLRDTIEGRDQPHCPAYARLFREQWNLYSARDENCKYVYDAAARTSTWFDLRNDPAELHPLNQAPAGAETLERYASEVTSSGGEGLHVLVTGSLNDPHTVAGKVTGTGVTGHSMYYPAGNDAVTTTEAGLNFRVTTSPCESSPPDLAKWYEQTQYVNNAHLIVKVDPTQSLSVAFTLDGRPAPPEIVHWGAERKVGALDVGSLPLERLVAPPQAFYACTMPDELAVYVWYVPPMKQVPREAVTTEMTEGLKTLGYL